MITTFKQIYLFHFFFTLQEQMDKCVININAMLPEYLKGLSSNPTMVAPADSTTPDLICTEQLSHEDSSSNSSSEDTSSNVGTYLDDSEYSSLMAPPTPSSIRSSSPLSAVDIFTDYNTNILQPMFDQVENAGVESFSTILVS